MKKIAVFASGGGTDFQSIIDANEQSPFCELALLIASKEGIGAIERAKRHDIPSAVFNKKNYSSLESMYDAMIALLRERGIDYIVFAGYLTIVTPNLVEAYRDRIINIHPSLIPAFCGKGYYGLRVHEAVLAYGAKVSGATVHFVEEGADTGAIILQEAVPVLDDDTPERLQQRILTVEHVILPRAVKLLAEGKIKKIGRKIKVED